MAKKILALVLAVMMIAALSVSAFAGDPTGKITITNASAGQTYELYKLLDATYNTDTKTTAYSTKVESLKTALANAESGEGEDAKAIFVVGETADSNLNYSVAVAEGMSDDALEWVKANAVTYGIKVDEKKLTSGNTIEWDVPYGYYYVKSALGTTLTIDTNTPVASIIDKNTTEPVTPTAPEDDPTNTGAKSVEEANASIGDTVHFTVEFTATNFVTKDGASNQITKYVITDTPAGLNLNSDIKVVAGNTTVLENESFKDSKLEVPWVDESGNSIYTSPIDVTVTYTGVLTAAAADAGKATNKAIISYLTKGSDSPIDINPNDQPVTTETYSFTLTKYDEGKKNKLSGAEFHLYDAEIEGNEIALVKDKDNDNVYHVADATEKAASGFTPAVIVAGEVTIKGLAAGDYYLEETNSPSGYNLLTERAKVTVVADKEKNSSVDVENKKGIELPSTGGIGTTVFYVVGSILVIGTAVVLLSKKRARG